MNKHSDIIRHQVPSWSAEAMLSRIELESAKEEFKLRRNSLQDAAPDWPMLTKPIKTKGGGKSRKKSRRKSAHAALVSVDTVQYCRFGKRSSFLVPQDTPSNQAAAVQIQRFMRGWWQRLMYRIMILKHQMRKQKDLAKQEIVEVREKLKERKRDYNKKLQDKQAKSIGRIQKKTDSVVGKAKFQIDSLKDSNKTLRESTADLAKTSKLLKEDNRRLEESNAKYAQYFLILRERAQQFVATNNKAHEAIQRYRERIDQCTSAVQERVSAGLSEYKMKLMYQKLAGDLIDRLDQQGGNNGQDQFVDEILNLLVALEKEHDDGSRRNSSSFFDFTPPRTIEDEP